MVVDAPALAPQFGIPAVPSLIGGIGEPWAAAVPPAFAAAALLLVLVGLPALLFVAFRAVGRRLHPDDALVGWMRLVAIPYTRWFQRISVENAAIIPESIGPRGLIVVSTHGSGLDPIAIQTEMRHPIRWMMSAEMMHAPLAWWWRKMRVIPVSFDTRDAAALKTAIAHVQEGGVLGIFPEGAIERPPRHLRPFSGGLRLILTRTQAPVLVATIDPGHPAETAYGALFSPTRARLRFVALVEPGPEGHGRDAAERIFDLIARETGWPVSTVELPPPDAAAVERNLAAFGRSA
jgi:1-acyl-sn-glycerol-3-phosphate acyltransferase